MARIKKSKITMDDFAIFDERAAQGIAVARAVDQGLPLPYSVIVHSLTFDEFIATLTPKRYELLRLAKAGKRTVTELAAAVQRNRSAVSRDIATLIELGFVEMADEPDSGRAAKRVVRAIADNIEIHSATT